MGSFVYATVGTTNRFRRYSPGTNTWAALTNAAATILTGRALSNDGTFLYTPEVVQQLSTDTIQEQILGLLWQLHLLLSAKAVVQLE